MQQDLEFEYPQKLEKMIIKSDILRLVEEEEKKLQTIARQKEEEYRNAQFLTYEEYYGLQPETQRIKEGGSLLQSSKKDIKFDEFVKDQASKYLFDNDLLEKSYKFWENDQEKHERLQKVWIDLKRKNALGGLEMRTSDD